MAASYSADMPSSSLSSEAKWASSTGPETAAAPVPARACSGRKGRTIGEREWGCSCGRAKTTGIDGQTQGYSYGRTKTTGTKKQNKMGHWRTGKDHWH
eukprot:365962-Chlamydomonas_euryale.AAC.3